MLHQGNLDEAVDAYKEAVQLRPKDAVPWGNLGHALGHGGKRPEALRALAQAEELARPGEYDVEQLIASGYADLGETDVALKHANRSWKKQGKPRLRQVN